MTEAGTVTGSLLVVDDDPGNRDMLARRLERTGYTVQTAEDGRSALHRIAEGRFDLVLLDVLMPGMSGLEVLRGIRGTHSRSELPVIMATALDRSEDIVEALRHGANDYVTKPFDYPVILARVDTQLTLKRAAEEIEALAQQLEIRNAFVRKVFGRYVSDEIVASLLESDEGLEIRGEKRKLSILMADVRGFSTLTEALSPMDVVSILNNHLGTMSEVIQSYRGTVDEFIGDAVLAFFGAPVAREDDTERSVACAIAMQRAMESVNERNRARGLPEIEMGIGIATGEVIVGNIGSEKRSKYGAIGSSVNLAARIESYTLGGEILISDATRRELGSIARIESEREVHPKGFEAPLTIHKVVGIGGSHDLSLPEEHDRFVELGEEIPVRFALLEGKDVANQGIEASIWAGAANGAKIRSAVPVAELSDIRIELVEGGRVVSGACYAKVVEGSDSSGDSFTVRFTTHSAPLDARLKQARAGAEPGP